MRKHRKALVWSLVALLVVIGVFLIFAQLQPEFDNQPVYNGRTLAQWLDTASRRNEVNSGRITLQQIDLAEDAIRAIGTNAYPCLLKWTRHRPSFAKRFFFGILEMTPMLRPLQGKLWGLTHRREQLAELGVQGFRILHTNAFAFETLSKMASDTNNPWMQEPAGEALLTITNTPGL
jgi:hypothetical protein